MEYIKKNLTNDDLISICILLGLRYDQEDKVAHIFKNLRAERLLEDAVDDEENPEEEEDDDEVGDEDDHKDEAAGSQIYSRRSSEARSNREVPDSKRHEDQGSECSVWYKPRPVSNRGSRPPRFTLNFRDVEGHVKAFDGKMGRSIKDWLQEFEETAAMMDWDELQMLIFAKKSLTGLAKQFVAGEKGLTSWPKLRSALLNEFQLRVNNRQIHQRLTERTMKKGEGHMEYLYAMKEMAAEGKIDDKDLMMYIIDGIRDLNSNKQMLYGARDLRDFKEKVRDYEEYIVKHSYATDRRNNDMKAVGQDKRSGEAKNTPKRGYKDNAIKCYNCGESGHKSLQCQNKSKGTKCFNCNDFGHMAKDCKARKDADQQKNVRCVAVKDNLMRKQIAIENQVFYALIDTGSHVNVMKASVYDQLKRVKMASTNLRLQGFGRNDNIKPMGCVTSDVMIENDVYELDFCVVPGDYMTDDLIIGAPLCNAAEVVVNPEGVRIKKWVIAEMMRIEAKADSDTIFDIEPITNDEVKKVVQNMVENYKPEKKKHANVSMKIVLTDETPIASRPRRLPWSERQIVEKQIEEWLANGVVECSESEFSSPVVLVQKKDGTKRLCVDYRRINKVIVRDRFPLPLIEDQLDRLQEATVFSTIDLKNGFFHVEVDSESRKYTAFVTHNGQYQFRKVPFGLANSPAVFQRFVNTIFRGLTQRGVALPYVDDVIIPAKSEAEAVTNLNEVLNHAKDYGLDLNLKKCHFMKKRIEFLGHVIENRTIAPSPAKMEAMVKYPVPRTLKQVESFLGLAGYFRKFIPEFAKEAKALSDLKRKDKKFIMGQEQVNSFETLKRKLCENPVLKIFDQTHETELHTDASADGYGAVLLQRSPDDNHLHPVYYMSKRTSDLESKYCSYELEILAVVEALKKFRVYLLGMKFKVVTDCNAFVKTMEKKDLSTRVSRWLLLLQEYDYVIEHRSGNQMRHVDALSRCKVMIIREEGALGKIARAQLSDEDLKAVFELLKQNETYNNYYLKSKILYKLVGGKELLVVPESLQYEVIKRAHEKGHFAIKKTRDLLVDDYFIPKLEEKIQRVVANCIECVMINRKKGRKDGELHPIPKHDVPLRTYHVDHLGPLESTHKMYKHIFVVIDAFTKFCWLYPTRSTTAREVIAKLQQQSSVFGNPELIISDRGTAFTADEFKAYCEEENIQHHTVTTGLPRANGQVERLNAIIIAVLAKLSLDEPDKWYKWVNKVQQVINATHQRSIGTTPFELLVGKPMRTKDELQIKQAVEDEMRDDYVGMREKLRRAAKVNIDKVQQENRRTYNLRRRGAMKYRVGELVAIKRTQFGGGLKLKAKYLGPYEVTKVKAADTYDVSKVGHAEGPKVTTTCAEYMKPWPGNDPSGAQG